MIGSADLLVELDPGREAWTVRAPALSGAPHVVGSPLAEERFLGEVRELREWTSRPILRDDPLAAGHRNYLQRLAHNVGERITSVLLAPAARERLAAALRQAAGRRVRLTIRVRDVGPLGDAALALPWELLAPQPGTFAVGAGALQVVREVAVEGAPDLSSPQGPLAVAAMIAAPEDRVAIPYEEEAYRLQLSLSALGWRVAFSDLGGLDDLVRLVEEQAATVLHFIGHGLPGRLLFEDPLGFAEEVAVEELARRLNGILLDPLRAGTFPRLFVLSSCFGAAKDRGTEAIPSTAAALHRCGFAQVLGYFGPLDAELSSRAEEAFYRALVRGESTLEAAEALRDALRQPVGAEGRRSYPLGWTQLAIYHRGPDLPLGRPGPTADEQSHPAPRRRLIEVSGLPVLERGFIGQRGVQHELLRRIRGGQRLIVLQGLGGLGKTALASQLVAHVLAPEPADQLILRCRDLKEGSDPVGELRTQAEEHGRVLGLPGWEERMKDLRNRVSASAAGFGAVVREIWHDRPNLVLYADNAESLQDGPETADSAALGTWKPAAEPWWGEMERLAEDGLLILASTRYGWAGLDSRAHLGIPPMTRADSLRLIGSFDPLGKLPIEVRKDLAGWVDGHPRTVELLNGLVGSELRLRGEDHELADPWRELIEPLLPAQATLIRLDLLLTALWHRVSAAAREHASRLGILREPAPLAVIDGLGTARDELIRAGLLTRYRQRVRSSVDVFWAERWGVLDQVKDFLGGPRGGSNEIESLHRLAGDAYEQALRRGRPTWGDQAEAIYHLQSASKGDRAWPLVEEFVTWLRDRSRLGEALEILARSEDAGLSGEKRSLARMFSIQIRSLQGQIGEDQAQAIEDAVATAPDGMSRHFLLVEKARLLLARGRYEEAEQLFRESLDAVRTILGEEDPEHGAALHAVAVSLQHRGELERSEDLLRRLADLVAGRAEEGDELFVAALQTLGGVLEAQGKYPEAAALARKVLDLREKFVGVRHPETGAALRTLALAMAGAGRYEEAEGLVRRSLAIYAQTLGVEHPAYGSTLHALAWIAARQGRYPEAEGFLRQALAHLVTALGAGHADVGRSVHLLALVLERRGQYEEAEELLRDTIPSLRERLGERHPSYAAALKTWGWVLERQGRYEQAEEALRQSLRAQEESRRTEHPAYGTSLQTLAVVLERRQQYAEGQRVIERSLEVLERSLGNAHPDFGGALFTAAGLLASQGKYPQAEEMLRRSLRVLEEGLGAEHPTLSPILTDLAIVLTEQGRGEEAEQLVRRALAIDGQAHEPRSPEVARILNILAQVEFSLRRPQAAETARQALSMLLETLGRDHPVTREAAPILLGILRRSPAAAESSAAQRMDRDEET